MKDDIGDRLKSFYEHRTRYMLPRRTFSIIRIDGKAFHSYTRGLKEPFDDQLMSDMDETAKFLCENIQGAKFAYVQSDEISILLTDFDKIETDAWFDGNIQKMCSVSASMATGIFNQLRPGKLAFFDSRVFTIPYQIEVENYFIWRQQDATRNSITSVAQSLYSHKELEGKNGDQKQEMIFQKGINWNDYAPRYKRGRGIIKEVYTVSGLTADENSQRQWPVENVQRTRWIVADVPVFTQCKDFFSRIFPVME
jgi:tRNA(His) 5'-end guanylyltransferase